MQTKKLSLILVFCICFSISFSQIPGIIFYKSGVDENYDAKRFSVIKKPVGEYMGSYHFGESESEWEMVFLKNNNDFIVQIRDGIWGKNYYTKKETWLKNCVTYNNIKLENGRFYFGGFSGMFAEYKDNDAVEKVVLLFCDPTENCHYGKDTAQLGFYSTSIDTFFQNDDFYQLSLKIMDESYFSGKTKQQLKIMRNTIYAKYGYIFQTADMENYFSKKGWYNPFLKNVDQCLTNIERKNIQTIKRLEQK